MNAVQRALATSVYPGPLRAARWWADRLPGWSVLGPSVHAFLDRTDQCPAGPLGLIVRAAGAGDLDGLRGRVTGAEWAESGFAGDDVALAWVATDPGGQVLAASNLTPFDAVPADVGVLAAAAARGRGLATAVAAQAARHAVDHHGIARSSAPYREFHSGQPIVRSQRSL